MILKTKYFLARALTIGLRYSVVRRQFRNISGQKDETQIIDYQTQQMKLFPILATMLAHTFTSAKIWTIYDDLTKEIANGDYRNMDLVHHLTSGGKSGHTQECQDALILIR